METVLAQAMPTPAIETSSSRGWWITPTLSNPAAPHSRHSACVPRVPIERASTGSRNATRNATSEYRLKHRLAHSAPCW